MLRKWICKMRGHRTSRYTLSDATVSCTFYAEIHKCKICRIITDWSCRADPELTEEGRIMVKRYLLEAGVDEHALLNL